MIDLTIPGRAQLQIHHLVLDVNGTLAVDGQLLDGIDQHLAVLRRQVQLHLLTADTHGRQAEIDRQLDLQATRIPPGDEARQKAEYINHLGNEHVAAIGQGANDAQMLAAAALGICIGSIEGTSVHTLVAADIFARDILTALDLLEHPLRIIATLRQ
jgi:P-type E1-E2 ATPase